MPTRKTTTKRKPKAPTVFSLVSKVHALRMQALALRTQALALPQKLPERRQEQLDAANHLLDASDQLGMAAKLLRPATARERAEMRRLFGQLADDAVSRPA